MFRQWSVQLAPFLTSLACSLVVTTGGGVAQEQEAQKREAQWKAEVQSLKIRIENQDLRLRELQTQIQAFKQRTTQLEAQVQKLTQELAGVRGAGAGKPPAVNPPAELIEGKVTAVQKDQGLIQLSVGSDAGLKAGHTLEVFRLVPQPKYLGVVEIIEVTPTESVGKMRGQPTTPVQVGDTVASRVK